jgi:hypothetical protein
VTAVNSNVSLCQRGRPRLAFSLFNHEGGSAKKLVAVMMKKDSMAKKDAMKKDEMMKK